MRIKRRQLLILIGCFMMALWSAEASAESVLKVVELTLEKGECVGLPPVSVRKMIETRPQELLRWVDTDARYWNLYSPVLFDQQEEGKLVAHEEFIVDEGTVQVSLEMDLNSMRFRYFLIPRRIPLKSLRHFFGENPPPCNSEGKIAVLEESTTTLESETVVSFYRSLHRASEKIYTDEFEESRKELLAAESAFPGQSVTSWLLARVYFLEAEAQSDADKKTRQKNLESSLRYALQALERDPDSAEAYLWVAISRGRIATSKGNIAVFFDRLGGKGGPDEIAMAFEKAISLESEYEHFGFSSHTDALYAAAQFYRILPSGALMEWLFDVQGNIDRSVLLSSEAVKTEPNRIDYAVELGADLLCRYSRRDKKSDLFVAYNVLESVQNREAYSSLDQIDQEHAKILMQVPPKQACAYSRDGWQDGSGQVGGSS